VVDWTDNTKRKAFREALHRVYPDPSDLEMFVDEELNENLAVVAGGNNLRMTAHSLIKWARAKGRLDEVYEAFKTENPSDQVIAILERKDFVVPKFNMTQNAWDKLFKQLLSDDLLELDRAFKKAFENVFDIGFQRIYPNHSSFTNIEQIREKLELYDADPKGPELAVRFVEYAIIELNRSNEDGKRDFTALKEWCSQITQQFKVEPPPPKRLVRHAYLLIALEEYGDDVIVYPEMWIRGAEKPVPFGVSPNKCTATEVAKQISQWIRQAEDALVTVPTDDTEVTLEIFLPCKYLDQDIATTWMIQDKWGDAIPLGIHRRFVVRSFDRIRDSQIQRELQRRWAVLENCIANKTVCDSFHLQQTCPTEKGILRALLDGDVPGLKFVAPLPIDRKQRTDLLNDIIDAAIPIALWSSADEIPDINCLKAELDAFLKACHLTNFADLARQWRKHRLDDTTADSIKPLRLLCDRPDRFPRLPDLENRADEDAIVAVA
jgi:hypothetical protein